MCIFATSNNRLLIHIEEASSFILCLGNRQLTNVARINIAFLFDDCTFCATYQAWAVVYLLQGVWRYL
ncbi:hypothetical protein [Dysgonomonas sp. 216]|uniref:hypothetical protein n=1 Tax=Dysgonomonas sp. 216 TaxID=2302934 RepID=UPI0013D51AE2|nr:hypothetical protein [Dysgonomonas sp. 216]